VCGPTTDRTGASRYGPRSVSSTLLVLQHIACEPPAALGGRAALQRPRSHTGGARRGVRGCTTGAPSRPRSSWAARWAPNEDLHPWLVEEKRHIRDTAQAAHPSGASTWEGSRSPARWARACTRAQSGGRSPTGGARRRRSDLCSPTHQQLSQLSEPGLSQRAGVPAAVPSRGDSRAGGRVGRRAGLRPEPGEDSGPGTLNRFMDEVDAHASSTILFPRGLFGRWLERVGRVPAQAIG
jgi:hypothetical protein